METQTQEQPISDLINTLNDAKYAQVLFVDTETTLEDIRDGRGFCMGVSLHFYGPNHATRSAYFPFRHNIGNIPQSLLSQLKRVIEEAPCIVFHNAKFDLVSLRTLGINYTGKFYDTMLMMHMIDENLPSKALDYCVKAYTGQKGKVYSDAFLAMKKVMGWNGIPATIMEPYAINDAEITGVLFNTIYDIFEREGFDDQLWDYEQDFVRLLIKMEHNGVRIDQDLCRREIATGEARMAEITESIGLNPGSTKDLEQLFIQELGLPVVKETPAGKASFDKFAMVEYEAMLAASSDPRASLILEYRGWQKTVSSNYRAYLDLLSPDGRLRPNYKIHGTKTGRLSCEKPNLQQIPRVSDKPWNGSLKRAFVASPGFTLWEADYSQLELRLAAAYAKEETLLQVFAEDRDIFIEMSGTLRLDRQDTKLFVYTTQYGGGINRISTVFNVDAMRAKEMRDNYFNKYPGFREISSMAQQKCRTQKQIRLWSGRVRHFADPEAEAHKAFNSVIQGGAAEIVKRTMLRLDKEVATTACRMLLQIHDSVVFEIEDGKEDLYIPLIHDVMENVTPDFGVKFKVNVHKWGE